MTRTAWMLVGAIGSLAVFAFGWWLGSGETQGAGGALFAGFGLLLTDAEANARRAARNVGELLPVEDADAEVVDAVASVVVNDTPMAPPSSAYLDRLTRRDS